jgi:hypothetical protein
MTFLNYGPIFEKKVEPAQPLPHLSAHSVEVWASASAARSFTGGVIYIYPYLEDKTRTSKVRVQLMKRGGRLKPGIYAHVELKSSGRSGIVVPINAVLDSGTEQVVFIAQGDGRASSAGQDGPSPRRL